MSSGSFHTLKRLTIVQWNMAGFRSNLHNLHKLLSKYEPDLIALQETNLASGIYDLPSPLSHYHLYCRMAENSNRGGVGFLVKRGLDHSMQTLQTHNETLSLTLTKLGIVIHNIYIRKFMAKATDDLEVLSSGNTTQEFFILGDFNAHSTLWGSFRSDAVGHQIERWLDAQSLSVLNNGNHTFKGVNDSKTHIDVSLATPNLCRIFGWDTTSPWDRDHIPIVITSDKRILKSLEPQEAGHLVRYLDDKANWDEFRKKLRLFLQDRPLSENPNKEAAILTRAIRFSANFAIPQTRATPNRKRQPHWWSQVCGEAFKQKKAAWRRYRVSPTQTNRQAYEEAYKRMKQVIKSAKTEAMNKLTDNISSERPPKENWKQMNRFLSKNNSSLRAVRTLDTPEGPVGDPCEIAQRIAVHLSKKSQYDANHPMTPPIPDNFGMATETPKTVAGSVGTSSWHHLDNPITWNELVVALSKCVDSSPGIDRISSKMIKEAGIDFHQRLLALYNSILRTGIYPHNWKVAQVTPIPKTRNRITDIEQIRPISVISNLSKILERILAERLSFLLEGRLISSIHGYRPLRGVQSLLHELQHHLAESINERKHSVVLSLDLKKAYDCIPAEALVKQMLDWRIGPLFINVIRNFLTSRRIRVKVRNCVSSMQPIHQGIPQGSPLSCQLFNVFIASLAICLYRVRGLNSYIYADNIILAASGRPDVVQRQLERAFQIVLCWCKEHKAVLSESKTEALHVCRLRNCPEHIQLNGKSHVLLHELNILGLMFSKTLTWTAHIELVETKVRRTLNRLLQGFSYNRGPPTTLAAEIIKALIYPVLDFCLTIYGLDSARAERKLQPLINKAARIALGALKTTQISSLLYASGMPDIVTRYQVLSCKFLLKNMYDAKAPLNYLVNTVLRDNYNIVDRTVRSPLINKYSALVGTLQCLPPHLISFPFKPIAYPAVPPYSGYVQQVLIPYKALEVETPENKKRVFLEFCEKTNPGEILFTDASKSEQTVCFAIVSQNKDLLMASCVPGWCSVYTAELLAIERACLLRMGTEIKTLIVSDSLSSIEAIKNPTAICPIVNAIKYRLHSNRNLFIAWCPSHVGIAGNEAADKEAKLACRSPLQTFAPSSYIDALRIVKASVRFECLDKLKASHSFFSTNAEEYSKWSRAKIPSNIGGSDRRMWVQITRLQLGHFLAVKQYLFTGHPQPCCRRCAGEKLTAWHIFVECPTAKEMYTKEGFTHGQSLKLLYPAPEQIKLFLNITSKVLRKLSGTCSRI